MPYSLISLCDSARSFLVRFGDFATQHGSDLRNAGRLHYAVLVTEGAGKDSDRGIAPPFSDPTLFLLEDTWFSECRMPINGPNCAALMASGFRWTDEAAKVANEFQVPAVVVGRIQMAIEQQYQEYVESFRQLLESIRQGATDQAGAMERRSRDAYETARQVVNWQEETTGDLPYDVILALGELGPIPSVSVPAGAVPALIRLAQETDADPRLRVAAARLLGRSGVAMEAALPVLIEMALWDRSHYEYAEAVLCGTSISEKGLVGEGGIKHRAGVSLPLLLNGLRNADYEVRRRAIQLLGRLGPETREAVAALRQTAEDHPKDRPHVEEALLRMSSSDVTEETIEKHRAARKAKARLFVPPLDPRKPRHSQFFRFTCPFCAHSEEVGLWYTSKSCPRCQTTIQIIRQSGTTPGKQANAKSPWARLTSRKWWRFWT